MEPAAKRCETAGHAGTETASETNPDDPSAIAPDAENDDAWYDDDAGEWVCSTSQPQGSGPWGWLVSIGLGAVLVTRRGKGRRGG